MDDEKEIGAQSLSLDLAKLALRSAEDMQRALAKLPDFKVRAEKPRADDIRLSDSKQPIQNQTQPQVAQATFPDPLPPSMQDVNLRELGRVNINWRMLTTSRPRNRGEEDLFNRFVLLERLQALTSQLEAESGIKGAAAKSRGVVNRGGGRRPAVGPVLAERRHETCADCATEFCSGDCRRGQHENHARSPNPPTFEAFQASLRKPTVNSRTVKKVNKSMAVEKSADTKKPQKNFKGVGKNAADQGVKKQNGAGGLKMAAEDSNNTKTKPSHQNGKVEGKTSKKKRKSKTKMKVSIKVPTSPIPES